MSTLHEAPPSLALLFPESVTLEEKAFRFLELHWDCKTFRRTARQLQELHKGLEAEKIHHTTVKGIFEFLKDTDVYFKFQELVSEQVEDFYSRKLMVTLFERYEGDIARAEKEISRYLKAPIDQRSRNDEDSILKWLKYKKSMLDKMATISLAVRGHFRSSAPLDADTDTPTTSDEKKALLKELEESEYGPDKH